MDTTTTRTCGCGCGAPVTRRYLPGHDARHKSALVQATRTLTGYARECAINDLLDRGWEAFADLDLLREHPTRNHRRQIRIHVTAVERWIVDIEGTHHARTGCTTLTNCAKRHNLVHPITKLAREACITRIDATPEIAHRLTRGFEACPTCTIDWTLDEVVETQETRRICTLASLDAIDGLNRKATKAAAARAAKAAAAKPRTWTVEPDPIPSPFAPPAGPAVALPPPLPSARVA